MSGLEKVLRWRIRSVKVYPDYYTKNTQTVSQLKTRVTSQVKEIVPGLTNCSLLLHTKKFFVQLKKDGGVGRSEIFPLRHSRPSGQIPVRSMTTCPGIMLGIKLIRSRPDEPQDPPDFRPDAPLSNEHNSKYKIKIRFSPNFLYCALNLCGVRESIPFNYAGF